jgi:hypothetical protein
MAIVINGSGTVTGIAVGGLPDGIVDAGTLATNSVDSAELIDGSIDTAHIATDQITSAILPAGSVLQVVQSVWEGTTTTTSNVLAATGLSCTITPSSSSSKILVTISGGSQAGAADDVGNINSIYRSINSATAATIAESGTEMQVNYAAMGGTYMITPVIMQKLDSPSTALSTEYFWYFSSRDNGNTSIANWLGGEVNMVLMEIAG